MFAVVDIETTGGPVYNSGITEVAIFVFDGEKIVEHYEQLIHPERSIPNFITTLTGISDAMVASAPTFEEVAQKIYTLLKDCVFVAHNVQFDFTYLQYHLKKHGYYLECPKLCTVRLSRKLVPGLGSYSLGSICRELDIPIHARHRAGGDALATVRLLHHLLSLGAEEEIAKMLKRRSYEQYLPLHLKREDILNLPQEEGVYYFHDSKDKIIYVGKAVNIRKRVLSHFAVQDISEKRQGFIREVHRVTYQTCVSELDALITECAEIIKWWPKYNRQLKKVTYRFGVYMMEDAQGYLRLALNKRLKYQEALCEFGSVIEGRRWLYQLCKEYDIPPTMFYLESADTRVPEKAEYNRKIQQVMEEVRASQATYVIKEEAKGQELYFLIERGVYKGKVWNPKVNGSGLSLTLMQDHLTPERDHEYIRQMLQQHALLHPDKVIYLQTIKEV